MKAELKQSHFVHADIWERNIIVFENCPIVIDYCNSAKKDDLISMDILNKSEDSGGIRGKFINDGASIQRIQKLLLNRIVI